MEAVGALAGGIAHDMNNVLAVVLGLGSVLEKEMGPKDPKTDDIREIILLTSNEALGAGDLAGLGLSMVYGAVNNHGGMVTIDSSPGEGTTVTMLLPAVDLDEAKLDLSMPVMDGAGCFEKLKEIDACVRVIICTGNGSSKVTNEMVGKGALSVMRKPFDLKQMSEAIAGALGEESRPLD